MYPILATSGGLGPKDLAWGLAESILGVITFVWILYGMIRSTRITLAHCNVVVCIAYRAVYPILAKSGGLGPKDVAQGLAESIQLSLDISYLL